MVEQKKVSFEKEIITGFLEDDKERDWDVPGTGEGRPW